MYADHDHRDEYADPQHDHDDRYAEDRHRHYGTEREVDQLTGALREASAQTELLRREHAEEIRQLWERVRQLETDTARGVQIGHGNQQSNTFG
jgi:uncharacterized membrane protein